MNDRLLYEVAEMDRDQLVREIYIDSLTGTYNRRAYGVLGAGHWVALVDVDSLKWVNDNHGHREGDALLWLVGRKLRDAFGQDQVFRISGDEFVVIGDSEQELAEGLAWVRDLGFNIFSDGIGRDLRRADDELKRAKTKPWRALCLELAA